MDDEVSKIKAQKKVNSLFVLACCRGYLDDVKGLLDRGADIAAVDKQGISALHFACGQGRLEVVAFLWSRGVELDTEDPGGNLPLHYAVNAAKEDVVGFLLSKGAWVEGSNERDDTVLHIAARKGQSKIVKRLMEHGGKADLKGFNKRGLTPLGEAVLGGHSSVAAQLIQEGADLDKASFKWPLLHLSVSLKQPAVFGFLIKAGCNTSEASGQDGSTALHCAAAIGDLDKAKALMSAGTSAAITDHSGKLAYDYVPKDNEPLRKVLQPREMSKQQPEAPKPKQPGLTSDLEDFKALNDGGRIKRIHKWADIEDPKQLERATLEFPLELKTQVAELRKLRQILNIQEAVVELLEDNDFQQLAMDPKARRVVEEVHADKDAFRKFVDDRAVMDLLRALQRFQGVVRVNGGHNVPFQALLRDAEPDYRAKSALRLKGMRMMLDARQRAAIAAALAGSEAEAKANAERELAPSKSGGGGQAGVSSDKGSSKSSPKQTSKPLPGPGSGTQRLQQPRNQEEYEQMLMADLPPQEPFSWKKFWQEMRHALMKSTAMFIVALVILKAVTGRFPWQITDVPSHLNDLVPEADTAQAGNHDYEF